MVTRIGPRDVVIGRSARLRENRTTTGRHPQNVTEYAKRDPSLGYSAPDIEMFRTLVGTLFSVAVLGLATAEQASTGRYDDGPSPSTPAQRGTAGNGAANRTAAVHGTEKPSFRGESGQMPVPWAAELFYQALADFAVQQDAGTAACQRQTQMYRRHLKNNTFWAVKSEYSSTYCAYTPPERRTFAHLSTSHPSPPC